MYVFVTSTYEMKMQHVSVKSLIYASCTQLRRQSRMGQIMFYLAQICWGTVINWEGISGQWAGLPWIKLIQSYRRRTTAAIC